MRTWRVVDGIRHPASGQMPQRQALFEYAVFAGGVLPYQPPFTNSAERAIIGEKNPPARFRCANSPGANSSA